MEVLEREIAEERMNKLGREKVPFLFIIDYEMKHSLVLPLNELSPHWIRFYIDGKTNYHVQHIEKNPPLQFEKHPLSFERYRQSFDAVQYHLQQGNSYLVNLTFPTSVQMNWTLEEVFSSVSAPFKLGIREKCVLFSPERFVRIENGIISTFPMKGTIDASIPNAHEILLNDEKEYAEHVTVVDLLRNDLSIVAKNVRVERFRYVDFVRTHGKNLLQVSSHITGILPPQWCSSVGTILFSLLPAGSISGAPKKKTLEIIAETELEPRDYYTGVFGYCDGEALDSAVMIRFIEERDGKYFYHSGGGITIYSDAEKEYRELIDKVYVPLP